MFSLKDIDKSWTLFLDRDGVINYEKQNDYIHHWDEFKFYEGVLDAFKIFSEKFNRIIVVTNQKGVGKGVTKEKDLLEIFENIQSVIKNYGAHIDRFYYCKDVDNDSSHRKPNAGMGLDAMKDFPDINPNKTIMVGNNISDMEFGRKLDFKNVYLTTTKPEINKDDNRIDLIYPSLISFAADLI